MSLYYFHSQNGHTTLDEKGTELASLDAVRTEAVLISREIILTPRGDCPRFGRGCLLNFG